MRIFYRGFARLPPLWFFGQISLIIIKNKWTVPHSWSHSRRSFVPMLVICQMWTRFKFKQVDSTFSGFLFNNAFIPNKFFKELVPNITVLETKRNRNLSEPSSKKQYFFKSFQFSWSWGKVRPKNYKIWNRLNIFEESTFLCTFQQIFYQMKFLRK